MARRRLQGRGFLLLTLLAVAGCGTACTGTPAELSPATPLAASLITAEVDVGSEKGNGGRMVDLVITNTTGQPMLITSATLHTPLYQGGTEWVPTRSGGTKVSAGESVGLPAALRPARCTAGVPSDPAPRITVTLDREAGQRMVNVRAGDPNDVLARRHAEECRGAVLESAAAARPGLAAPTLPL